MFVAICTVLLVLLPLAAGIAHAHYSDRKPRCRVDWPKVYEMELEVWDETFEHAGAPLPYREAYRDFAPYNALSDPTWCVNCEKYLPITEIHVHPLHEM